MDMSLNPSTVIRKPNPRVVPKPYISHPAPPANVPSPCSSALDCHPALGSSRCARRLVHAHIAIAINPGCAAVYELPQDVTRLQRPLPTRSYTVIRSAHAPDKVSQDPHSRPIVLLPCQPSAVLPHSSPAPLASPVRVSTTQSWHALSP